LRSSIERAMRVARTRGGARDSRHRPPGVPRNTHGFVACYHRPSPVVSSVPVTGRTVTMPDVRARSRISSLLQTWAGLRCSTPRLRYRKR
jgi:hypothetical protein